MINENEAKRIISDLRDDYDKNAVSFAISRDKMWPELKFLFDSAKGNEKVLDVGCGSGRFFNYLKDTDYTGIDFSKNLINEAKKRFPNEKFIVGDALSLPFKDNSFDKVYSIAVLHQIPKEEYRFKALNEIKRVLKKDGVAFITVWNIKSDSKILKSNSSYFLEDKNESNKKTDSITQYIINHFKKFRKRRNFFLKRKRYYYIFKKKELSKLAKEVGFKVIEEGVLKRKTRSNFYIILQK